MEIVKTVVRPCLLEHLYFIFSEGTIDMALMTGVELTQQVDAGEFAR